MTSELWLVRHGESTANVAADHAEASGAETIAATHRDADVPLSELGVRQSAALGRWIDAQPQRPRRILVSPYTRAQQTAHAALPAEQEAGALTVDERLRDRELGVLDLLTSGGVEVRYPVEAARRRWLGKFYYRPPGGESWADVTMRVRQVLAGAGGDGTGTVLVVSHAAVVTLTASLLLGWPEQELLNFAQNHVVGNASMTRLRCRDGLWQLIEFAAVDHLRQLEVPITQHPGDQDAAIH